MEVYFYKSNTDFEYYFYNNIIITIQEIRDISSMEAYASIKSEPTYNEIQLLEMLKSKNTINTVSIETFKSKLSRAIEIISKKLE